MSVFTNRFNELRSGWSVAAAMVLVIIGQGTSQSLVPEGMEEDIAVKIVATLVYSVIVISGGILLFKLTYKRSLRQMGLIKSKWLPELVHGLVVGAAAMGLVLLVLLITGQAAVLQIDTAKLLSAAMVVEFISICLFAFSEELVARGYIMTALKTTRNKYIIFFVSAVIFSLAHLLNPGVTLLSFINALLAGLLFSYMFIKTGKLWFCSGFHIAWNFMGGDVFGMMVSGNEQAAVFSTSLGSNELLTGGAYGPEGGILVTAILILCFAYTHVLVKNPKDSVWTLESDLPQE